jgi:hypothetical protein
MSQSRSAIFRVTLIALFTLTLNINRDTTAQGADGNTARPARAWLPLPRVRDWSEIQVRLSARHSTTSWDERDPHHVKFELPLLYLHHERDATQVAARTLQISLAGLGGGREIEVEAISQHANAYTDEAETKTQRFLLPDRLCTGDDPCTLQWTFDPGATLSDLYHLRIKSATGELLWADHDPGRPDFVILDTWDVGIGAYTVRVYYATLFPYARDPKRIDYRLPPEAVPGFIESTFVPLIRDTWHTQLEEWGFGDPLHPDWDADQIVEVIITNPPFALFDGSGTYTVFTDAQGHPYPERRIWWLSTHAAFQRYDSWENAHRAIFAHEFFHLAQWNVLLNTGRSTHYWLNTFIEAQAEFAVGVQYPELEIAKGHVLAGSSAYGNSANLFLAERLNVSYRDLEADPTSKYDLALYWRFLYEQYGGMGVLRAALEEMAYRDSPDIVTSLGDTMDAAFDRAGGPYGTFEESLVAYARANYALRLDNGRCVAADLAACGGRYYDPDDRYVDPPLEAELAFDGSGLTYSGAVPSSYGMDFVEVGLSPTLRGQPLTIRLQREGKIARFNVQIWKLGSSGSRPRTVTLQPEQLPQNQDGVHVYAIPHVDTTVYDRLALIITRVDGEETADPHGNYRVTLDAALGSSVSPLDTSSGKMLSGSGS